MSFIKIDPKKLNINPFTTIGEQWMLITAGTEEKFNTMTASWGGLGVLWRKDVSTVYIRPQRYTKEFVEKEELYTLSFFDESHRKALNLCGTVSGRDRDKVTEAGLTPVFDDGTVFFGEAEIVLVCKKMYQDTIKEEQFEDGNIPKEHYPNKDFHEFYIGEIISAYVKEK